jgi:hypothetical protein
VHNGCCKVGVVTVVEALEAARDRIQAEREGVEEESSKLLDKIIALSNRIQDFEAAIRGQKGELL